jgi:tripartite-type tricarboxylate transporter receptor subunit TctC
VIGDDPEDFARVVHADYARWRRIIHEAGIAAE